MNQKTHRLHTQRVEGMARERQTLIVLLIITDMGMTSPRVKYGHGTRNDVNVIT